MYSPFSMGYFASSAHGNGVYHQVRPVEAAAKPFLYTRSWLRQPGLGLMQPACYCCVVLQAMFCALQALPA